MDWCQKNNVTVLFGEWGPNRMLYPNGFDEKWAHTQAVKLNYLINDKGYDCIKIIDVENEPYNNGIQHWPEYRI